MNTLIKKIVKTESFDNLNKILSDILSKSSDIHKSIDNKIKTDKSGARAILEKYDSEHFIVIEQKSKKIIDKFIQIDNNYCLSSDGIFLESELFLKYNELEENVLIKRFNHFSFDKMKKGTTLNPTYKCQHDDELENIFPLIGEDKALNSIEYLINSIHFNQWNDNKTITFINNIPEYCVEIEESKDYNLFWISGYLIIDDKLFSFRFSNNFLNHYTLQEFNYKPDVNGIVKKIKNIRDF
jgi:hypothetical protein